MDPIEIEEMEFEAEAQEAYELTMNISARFMAERSGMVDYYEGAY